LAKKTDSPPKGDYLKDRLDELFASIPVVPPNVPPAGRRRPSGLPPAFSAPAALLPARPVRGPYRQAFENLPVGMLLLHLDGRILRANAAFCRLLGYDRRGLVGLAYQQLVHPQDLPASARLLRTMLLEPARNATVESRLRRKDGQYAWFELHLALVADAANKPASISMVVLDASPGRAAAELERRLHEMESLRQSQQQELQRQAAGLPALSELSPADAVPALPAQPTTWESLGRPAAETVTASVAPQPRLAEPTAEPPSLPAAKASAEGDKRPRSSPAWGEQTRADAPLTAGAALALPGLDGTSTYATPWARLSAGLSRVSFAIYLTLYLVGISLAEFVTTYTSPQLGLVIHGGLLVLFILHASIGATHLEQKFLFTLALAPLIRLLSLSMPLLQFPFTYWYLVIGAPLLLAVWLVFRLIGYTRQEVGLAFGRRLPLQIAVALSGVALGYLEYKILKPAPLVESFSLQTIWLPAFILLVFTGFLEELIFRGLMQRASQPTIGKLGVLYISILFAVLHIGYRSLTDILFVFLVGLYFGLIVTRTRSIFGVTLAHGLTNIALFLVFPFLPY
jgi:hypothetical protein